jgi:hypothetical protein
MDRRNRRLRTKGSRHHNETVPIRNDTRTMWLTQFLDHIRRAQPQAASPSRARIGNPTRSGRSPRPGANLTRTTVTRGPLTGLSVSFDARKLSRRSCDRFVVDFPKLLRQAGYCCTPSRAEGQPRSTAPHPPSARERAVGRPRLLPQNLESFTVAAQTSFVITEQALGHLLDE